ncbi:MAG: hypothetical protein JWP81_664 [Ferruginibacter sp.]|nr:hypothetical protein [Ferruginibacter sp.]
MNRFLKTYTIFLAMALLFACNNGNNTSATGSPDSLGSDKPAAMDTTVGLGKTSTTVAEQSFLNYLVLQNAREIASLDAAIAKGLPNNVKEHALMMLKDHNRLDEDIKYFLSMKSNLKMPQFDTISSINNTDSVGWAQGWADKMLQDHTGMLDSLKKAKTEITDADLNRIITRAIPVIYSHVSMSKRVKASLKK